MFFKVLIITFFFTICLVIKNNSDSTVNSGLNPKTKTLKNSLNLTKRKNLFLGDILYKYPSAKNITIVAPNRGSVSFHPEELNGGRNVNIIYSKYYDVFITNKNDSIIKERIK